MAAVVLMIACCACAKGRSMITGLVVHAASLLLTLIALYWILRSE